MQSNVIPLVQPLGRINGKETFIKLGEVERDPNALKLTAIKDHGSYFIGEQRDDGFLVWGWGDTFTEAAEHAAERLDG